MECNYNIPLNILESIFKFFDLIAINMLNSFMHLFTKDISMAFSKLFPV